MKNIGIIYGSDTGVTQDVTEIMLGMLGDNAEVIEVYDAQTSDFQRFDLVLLGLSTWYDGELQSDWEYYLDTFKTIDFTDQIVALYGLGDQDGYPEYFIDGVGILAEIVLKNGGTIIGIWPTEGYDFQTSKALKSDSVFYGLALDEDNQQKLTEERLQRWIDQLRTEYAELSTES